MDNQNNQDNFKEDVELHPNHDDSDDDYEVVADDDPQFEDTAEKELNLSNDDKKEEDKQEDDEDDDDDDDVAVAPAEGSYDPSEFDDLNVDDEVRDPVPLVPVLTARIRNKKLTSKIVKNPPSLMMLRDKYLASVSLVGT